MHLSEFFTNRCRMKSQKNILRRNEFFGDDYLSWCLGASGLGKMVILIKGKPGYSALWIGQTDPNVVKENWLFLLASTTFS